VHGAEPTTARRHLRAEREDKAIVADALAGASAVVYLTELDEAARAEALRNAGALLTFNTSKELRSGEAELLDGARLIQFIIAGVDFIPLSELPEGVPVGNQRRRLCRVDGLNRYATESSREREPGERIGRDTADASELRRQARGDGCYGKGAFRRRSIGRGEDQYQRDPSIKDVSKAHRDVEARKTPGSTVLTI
jgi:hypothetical protein